MKNFWDNLSNQIKVDIFIISLLITFCVILLSVVNIFDITSITTGWQIYYWASSIGTALMIVSVTKGNFIGTLLISLIFGFIFWPLILWRFIFLRYEYK